MEIVDLSVATGSIALNHDGITRERNHSIWTACMCDAAMMIQVYKMLALISVQMKNGQWMKNCIQKWKKAYILTICVANCK